jgi:hypothetical protein
MRIALLLFAFLLLGVGGFSQSSSSISEEMVTCFKTGNSSNLSKLFNASIDLAVHDVDDVYSRNQAEQILKKFFAANKPTNFTIIHRGTSKMDIQYFIGKLETSKENYRVTIHIKEISDKDYIQQLRIESVDFDF